MQEGVIYQFRLVIPPTWAQVSRCHFILSDPDYYGKWDKAIDELKRQGLTLTFNGRPYDKGCQVVGGPDVFLPGFDSVHFVLNPEHAKATLLPDEYKGCLDKARLYVNMLPQSQRLCVAWIKCAKRLKVHRDTIRLIGEFLLVTWEEVEPRWTTKWRRIE